MIAAGGRTREPWWVVALAWLGFLVAFGWFALLFLSELAPGLLAPLHPWLHSFLFG